MTHFQTLTNPSSYDVVTEKWGKVEVLGSVNFYPGIKGWLFISQVQGHGNSRTPRDYPHLAVPQWALRRGAKLRERAS